MSRLITRYAVFENLYLRTSSAAKGQLTQSLIKLYAGIMRFLVKAGCYYGQNTASRFIRVLPFKS